MAEAVVPTKQCITCQAVKPREQFAVHSRFKDGRDSTCKACRYIVRKAWAQSERGKAKQKARRAKPATRAYQKQWRKTEVGQEALARERRSLAYKERMRRYYEKNRGGDKVNARAAVCQAVSRGKLPAAKTLTCACGKPAEHYHHHLGYTHDHRLHVVPLCAECHYAAERAS